MVVVSDDLRSQAISKVDWFKVQQLDLCFALRQRWFKVHANRDVIAL